MSEPAATLPRLAITVLGAGRVGGTLGARWAQAGHTVRYGVRDPGDPRFAGLVTATPADAVDAADVVLVALPWAVTEQVLRGVAVGAATVLDATNPLAVGARELVDDPRLSGAELIASWTGSARVVKAFNTTGSANMADPGYPSLGPTAPMMPVAGDDESAKATALGLAAELGFDPVDAGPLSAARDLEHVAALWIRLAYALGNGPGIAFALGRR